MTNFDYAFEEIIGIEGGLSNHQNDNGGLTKYGISQRAFPNLNIRNLTLAKAKDVYYRNYWKTPSLNLEDYNKEIAIELFDIAVNSGVSISAKILQRALNLMNRNEVDFKDLIVDGNAGANTVNAYRKVDKDILYKVLNGLQFMRFVNIVEYNLSQEVFFNGWMKRV